MHRNDDEDLQAFGAAEDEIFGFPRATEADVQRWTGRWSSGLCCWSNGARRCCPDCVEVACIGCCCFGNNYCVMSRILARLTPEGQHIEACNQAAAVACLLDCSTGLGCLIGDVLRRGVMRRYKIRGGSGGFDVEYPGDTRVLSVCCSPCSLAQLLRELEAHGEGVESCCRTRSEPVVPQAMASDGTAPPEQVINAHTISSTNDAVDVGEPVADATRTTGNPFEAARAAGLGYTGSHGTSDL